MDNINKNTRNMRNDRRTPLQLQELIKKKVRVNLTSWEKRNIKELYLTELKSKIKENCGSCWLTAIEELSRLEQKEVKPILVKEKMIVHEAPKQKEIDINELTLSELRELYPNIKATSKKVFIEKIIDNGN